MRNNQFFILFFMMVILSLFSFNNSNCMKREAAQALERNAKSQRTEKPEDYQPQLDAFLKYEQENFEFIQKYINSRPIKIQKALIKAATLVKNKKSNYASGIYRRLIDEYQEPIAYFFLGKLFENIGDDDFIEPYLTAHKYYILAIEHHFAEALPELLALGQVFAEFIEKSQGTAHS